FDLSQIRFSRCRLPLLSVFQCVRIRSSNRTESHSKGQERLLGDWTSTDGKEKMKVRKLDDSVYIVYYDGDLFRAYYSDIAEPPFAGVQDLNSNDRKYA